LREDVRNAPVLMVTSAGPGEGKSLVSANLAVSLAQDGRRTLLVGADLRRPALTKIFGGDREGAGLADVLQEKVRWQAALFKNDVPNLDVLLSGRIPSHPAELLGRRALSDFLREAKEVYEHVIVDAPPVLGVSDSLVLLPDVDGVLFVVRYGVTHSLGASHAALKLRESGTPCLGSILNGVNLNSMANYYYYGATAAMPIGITKASRPKRRRRPRDEVRRFSIRAAVAPAAAGGLRRERSVARAVEPRVAAGLRAAGLGRLPARRFPARTDLGGRRLPAGLDFPLRVESVPRMERRARPDAAGALARLAGFRRFRRHVGDAVPGRGCVAAFASGFVLSRRQIRRLEGFVAVAAAAMALVVLAQRLEPNAPRIRAYTGIFVNENHYAVYANLLLPVVLAAAARARFRAVQAGRPSSPAGLYLLAAGLAAAATVACGSRAGVAVMALLVAACVAWHRRTVRDYPFAGIPASRGLKVAAAAAVVAAAGFAVRAFWNEWRHLGTIGKEWAFRSGI
jgi:capsular exopolysaccharide synthesis family protein